VTRKDLEEAIAPLLTADEIRDELEPIEEELATIGEAVDEIQVHVFSHLGVVEQSGADLIGQAIGFANEALERDTNNQRMGAFRRSTTSRDKIEKKHKGTANVVV
jgi:hypothetical protein